MRTRLIAAAALALATTPLVVAAAPVAEAAEPCTPSITMAKPVQTAAGFVNWTAYYTACEDSQVRIKYRDRDVAGAAWLGGGGLAPAGSGYQTSGYCKPDGQPHRWVGYATLKTATGGIVLAKTPKVYFKATAVTGDCPH